MMAVEVASVWTGERLEQLTKLWGQGLSITQIGLKLGVTRNAVVGKVHRVGLPKRQSPIVRSNKPFEPKRKKRLPLTFSNWDRNKCSWPIGDPKSPDFKFCSDKIVEGRPYCSVHCSQAYTTSNKDERALKLKLA
jgi:GcrA cell cycle regulator